MIEGTDALGAGITTITSGFSRRCDWSFIDTLAYEVRQAHQVSRSQTQEQHKMNSASHKTELPRKVQGRFLPLVSFALFCVGSSMAYAEPAVTDIPSIVVSFSALDLTTDEGARKLYGRIAAAGRAVCPDADFRNLGAYARAKSCQSEAIARAVRDVHSTRLATVYSEHANHG